MKNIRDIWISNCLPLAWYKDELDLSKLVYVGKKRVRSKCGKKITYEDEYVYWYPENILSNPEMSCRGEYYRSTVLLGDIWNQ